MLLNLTWPWMAQPWSTTSMQPGTQAACIVPHSVTCNGLQSINGVVFSPHLRHCQPFQMCIQDRAAWHVLSLACMMQHCSQHP